MKLKTALLPAAAAVILSACVPAPAPVAPPAPLPAVPALAPVTGVAGLQERQPDLCKAQAYTGALGQSRAVIPSLGITRAYRVVEYRGIEPQEYDPNRIVFRLDAAGNVYNIDCG